MKNKEFLAVLKEGKAVSNSWLTLKCRKSPGPGRCGFLVSARIFKKAVLRNRIKRKLREAWRQVLKDGKRKGEAGSDLVFIARSGIEAGKLGDVKEVMSSLLNRAGI